GMRGYALCKSDGTEAGTVLVKDNGLKPFDSYINQMTDMNGTPFGGAHDTLFFSAYDGVHGEGLWRSNGTEASTTRIADLVFGWDSGSGLVNVNGTPSDGTHDVLFFTAFDDSHGQELYKSDGTPEGTVMVRDIHAGAFSSYPSWLTNMNGTLFFGAYGNSGAGLYKSDGTEAGTVLLGTNISGLQDLTSVNDTSFDRAHDVPFGQAHDVLFFAAYVSGSGYVLYKSDGTTAGTAMVKDIYPGCLFCGDSEGVPLSGLTDVSGTLFFSATDGEHGSELYKSDGTEAGTVMVRDIWPGSDGSAPYSLVNANGTLFFQARDDIHGAELYKSDGTEAGTVLVKDINPGPGDSSLAYLVNLHGVPFGGAHGMLFFSADDGVHGRELYKSDGTEEGTVLVGDVYPGKGSSNPTHLANVGGVLFFNADDGIHGRELWMSDGTEQGTVRVGDVYPGEGSSDPTHLAYVGGRLYFSADDGVHGRELWALSIGPDLALTQTVTPT
ncbi:MAG: hypothetical protein GY832_17130, partial [Chloroflexi bacterium]|nr:hypothetical protein [Chloroflexota bacterium]